MLWGRTKAPAREDSEPSELVENWHPARQPPRIPADGQLAFPSERDRSAQQQACEVRVQEGCVKGLRAACSLQAARQCSPPPLLRLLGLAPEQSWEAREACEQRCMDACLQQRSPACQKHAAVFCADAFSGPVAGGAPQPAQPLQPAPSGSGTSSS